MRTKKYLFLLLLATTVASCDDKYISSVPDMPVFLTIDLNVHNTFRNSNNRALVFDKPIKQGEAVGYGGLLVYTTTDSKYMAWDMACPHEKDQKAIVELEQKNTNDNVYYAICPVCGSKYELLYGIGNPISGPSKEILRPYKVRLRSSLSGDILTVFR